MTFDDFIEKFDTDNSIVLLEGKRVVEKTDEEKLFSLGRLLATRTKKMLFRSGNASGSDQFFSLGVASVDKERLQVVTPYTGHRKKTNQAYETISLDDINLVEEPEVVYQSRNNKKTEKLIDRYVSGDRDQFSIKAAYVIRDTVKAIGTKNIKPATFGIFYDDLQKPSTGGTGHTMKICEQNNIPIIDQNVWFNWLKN